MSERLDQSIKEIIDFRARTDNSMKFLRWIGVTLAVSAIAAVSQMVYVAQNFARQEQSVFVNKESIDEMRRINAEQMKAINEINLQLAELKTRK